MSQKTSPPGSVPTRVSGGVPWWLWLILVVFGGGVGIALVQRAIPVDPDQAYQEGLAAVDARDIVKLESSVKTLTGFPDHAGELKLLEGMVMLGKSKPLLAIPLFQEAATDPKIRIKALSELGNAYMRSTQRADCLATFETVLREDPDEDTARLTLAFVLKESISWDETLKHLEILQQRNFKPEAVHQMIGDIYGELGRYKEAAEAYEVSLKADLNSPASSARAARLLLCRIETGELSGLDEYLPIVDAIGVRESVRALLLMEIDETANALTTIEHALQENATDPTANLTYGKIMARIGTKERAIEALVKLRQTMRAQTRNRELFEIIAQLATIAGDETMAIVAQQNVDQLRDLEAQCASKLLEVVKTRDGLKERLELGDLAMEVGRFELANSSYRSVAAIDKSQESEVEARISDHFELAPPLVPFIGVDPAEPTEPVETPGNPGDPPPPEPAPKSDKAIAEPGATASPEEPPADEAKKPEEKAE